MFNDEDKIYNTGSIYKVKIFKYEENVLRCFICRKCKSIPTGISVAGGSLYKGNNLLFHVCLNCLKKYNLNSNDEGKRKQGIALLRMKELI